MSFPRSLPQALRAYVPNPLRRAVVRARFGDLRRTEPVSEWGFGRGTPVDRWYIERFLTEHAHLVRGHALEVKEDLYASRFGAESVAVIDIDAANEHATVVGDLCDASTLDTDKYDVAIVTQTLQLLPRPLDAVRNLLDAVKPGGSLLVTVPTMSRLAGSWDRWRWTPAGMSDLLTEAAPPGAAIESVGMGNGLAARAFLFGLAVRDLDEAVLGKPDADFPLIVGGQVQLPR